MGDIKVHFPTADNFKKKILEVVSHCRDFRHLPCVSCAGNASTTRDTPVLEETGDGAITLHVPTQRVRLASRRESFRRPIYTPCRARANGICLGSPAGHASSPVAIFLPMLVWAHQRGTYCPRWQYSYQCSLELGLPLLGLPLRPLVYRRLQLCNPLHGLLELVLVVLD